MSLDDGSSLQSYRCVRRRLSIRAQSKLDSLAKQHPSRFKVHYVVSKPGSGFSGTAGFVTKDLLKAKLPPPAPTSLVLICGPPGMMTAVSGNKAPDYSQGEVAGILKELGYTKEIVFKF